MASKDPMKGLMGSQAERAGSGKLVKPRPLNGGNGKVTESSTWPLNKKVK